MSYSVTPFVAFWIRPGTLTTVNYGRVGPSISKLRTSLVKARVEAIAEESLVDGFIPIAVAAFDIIPGNSAKSAIVAKKALIVAFSAALRFSSGIMLRRRESTALRRRVISIAKRVQRLSFRGKGTLVKASRTELLPED